MKTILKFIIPFAVLVSSTVLNAQNEQPMIGQTAPSFKLQGLDGKTYSLEQFRGKYVVIHFAATWCPFCNAEASQVENSGDEKRGARKAHKVCRRRADRRVALAGPE